MPTYALKIEVVKPSETDPQLDINGLEYCGDANSANKAAKNCFLLRIREIERTIILKVLLGYADQTHGNGFLNNHYNTTGFTSAGGGMLWTAPPETEDRNQLCIGSYSGVYNAVPERILELIKEQIAEVLRGAGAEFDSIVLCPTGDTHPNWKREPYCSLVKGPPSQPPPQKAEPVIPKPPVITPPQAPIEPALYEFLKEAAKDRRQLRFLSWAKSDLGIAQTQFDGAVDAIAENYRPLAISIGEGLNSKSCQGEKSAIQRQAFLLLPNIVRIFDPLLAAGAPPTNAKPSATTIVFERFLRRKLQLQLEEFIKNNQKPR